MRSTPFLRALYAIARVPREVGIVRHIVHRVSGLARNEMQGTVQVQTIGNRAPGTTGSMPKPRNSLRFEHLTVGYPGIIIMKLSDPSPLLSRITGKNVSFLVAV